MKIRNIKVTEPVQLVPLTGETSMSIASTGKYMLNKQKPRKKQKKSESAKRVLAKSDNKEGRLIRSPKGIRQTVVMNLPSGRACRAEYSALLDNIFDNLELESNLPF